MNFSTLSTLTLSSVFLFLAACSDKPDTSASTSPATSRSSSVYSSPDASASVSSNATSSLGTSSASTTDAWVGKWTGPEGTFLDISGSNGRYEITIEDLDGAKKYQGIGNGNRISFERDGTTEFIQASNGTETGMKWLDGKSNCLRVREGEGWCRD